MISIICTDGQMDIKDIQKECIKGKWIPLMVLVDKVEHQIRLPVFNLEDIARQFVKRNLPKRWSHGCVFLSNKDIAEIIKKGWKIEPFSFPKKVSEHPDFTMTFEIHEFQEEPDFNFS